MSIVARPTKETEPDLLKGHELEPVIITDLDDVEVKRCHPPKGGWDFDTLEAIDYSNFCPEGWNAYLGAILGRKWIGCSEI